MRTVLSRAVASARGATGSALLEVDLPDVAVLSDCDAAGLERALAHLLVSVLSHSDATSAVRLRLTERVHRATQLVVEAPGSHVPTSELHPGGGEVQRSGLPARGPGAHGPRRSGAGVQGRRHRAQRP